jgi:putative transposase
VTSREKTEFHAFDQSAEIEIRNRNLPHWFQPGAAIFVTFRTADSIPKDALHLMRRRFEDWLSCQSLPVFATEWFFDLSPDERRQRAQSYPKEVQTRMFREYQRLFQHSLDDCHGECLLEIPENLVIISEAIRYYDGQKYDLDCFVIMPNHVHAIVQFRPGFNMSIIGQSWMRYSARRINQRMKRQGHLWQSEAFDHIIRGPEQFSHTQEYIRLNPAKAKLTEGRYCYWKRGS